MAGENFCHRPAAVDRDQGAVDRSLVPILARLRARLCDRPVAEVVAVGRRGIAGWQVALLGGGLLAELSTEQARALAAQILATCDLLEGGAW